MAKDAWSALTVEKRGSINEEGVLGTVGAHGRAVLNQTQSGIYIDAVLGRWNG